MISALAPARINTRAPAWLMAPALVGGAIAVLPLLYVVIRAAGSGESPGIWSTLAERATLLLVGRSIALAVLVATGAVVVSFMLAFCTELSNVPFRRLLTVLAVAPMAVPCYVGALAYIHAMSPQGVIGSAAHIVGIDRLPVFSGFWAGVIVLILFTYPFAYLPIRASMRRISTAQIEASRSLGKPTRMAVWHVIIPCVAPGAAVGALLVALYTLGEFGAVSLLRCNTFTRVIYLRYKSSFDLSSAAVLALVLIVIVLFVLALFEWLDAHWREPGTEVTNRARYRFSLGPWRWVGAGLCALVALASVGLTVGVLVKWVWQGMQAQLDLGPVWSALSTTAWVSAAAGALCALVAVPIALVSTRFRSPLGALIERFTHLGFALPGIVIALGMVFFLQRIPDGKLFRIFNQSWLIVILAYVVLYLPLAVGSVRAVLMRIPPRLEEAGLSLGRSRFRVIATVTIAMARPGIIAGGLLVFLTAMKELPATLLLRPFGTETLAVQVWDATEDARFAQASLPALMMIALSCGVVAIIVRKEGMMR